MDARAILKPSDNLPGAVDGRRDREECVRHRSSVCRAFDLLTGAGQLIMISPQPTVLLFFKVRLMRRRPAEGEPRQETRYVGRNHRSDHSTDLWRGRR
jgi:hypothetical protein